MPLLLAAVLLLGLSLPSRADWLLNTADFQPHQHLTINTWNPAESLSATDASGKLITISTRDILSLDSGRQITTANLRGWRLTLRNGDLLVGEPVRVSGQSLLYKMTNLPDLGTIAIPLKLITSLTVINPGNPTASPPAAATNPSEKDLVRTRGDKPGAGDNITGIILNIDDSSVQLASGDNLDHPDINLKLADVERITFGGIPAPRTTPPLSARLTLTSGSILTIPLDPAGKSFSWVLGTLNFKDPAGKDRSLDTDHIASLEILGGRILYLTELDPASQQQTSFLDTTWPAQFNKNTLGQPLRVAHNTYTRGIGVHTRSALAYDLDGSYETLSFRAGLDDSAAPYGQAHLYITLDGKTLWDAPLMKPGEISPQLDLPIKGGKHLELHADPTTRLDVLGRVNWLEIALRR